MLTCLGVGVRVRKVGFVSIKVRGGSECWPGRQWHKPPRWPAHELLPPNALPCTSCQVEQAPMLAHPAVHIWHQVFASLVFSGAHLPQAYAICQYVDTAAAAAAASKPGCEAAAQQLLQEGSFTRVLQVGCAGAAGGLCM